MGERTGNKNWKNRHQVEPRVEKFLCRFPIGIVEDSKFRVVGRLIGPGGQRMKDIAAASGAKLRVRGRGSNFLEGPERKESTDPLMLCISAQDEDGFRRACDLVTALLEEVYKEYHAFCIQSGKPVRPLAVRREAQPGH